MAEPGVFLGDQPLVALLDEVSGLYGGDVGRMAIDDLIAAIVSQASISITGATPYVSTSAGLTGTTEGGYFSTVPGVSNADVAFIIYRKVSGAAVEQSRIASAALVSGINSRLTAAEAAGAPYADLISQASTRPGDTPLLFSNVAVGKSKDRPALAYGVREVSTGLGAYWRIRGIDIDDGTGWRDTAPRIDFQILPGRTYLVFGRAVRLIDPGSPQPVQLRWQNLNGNGNSISNVLLKSQANPTVASGVFTLSALIGMAGALGTLDYIVPGSTVYGLPVLRSIANGQDLAIIDLGVRDVTDQISGGADVTALTATVVSQGVDISANANSIAATNIAVDKEAARGKNLARGVAASRKLTPILTGQDGRLMAWFDQRLKRMRTDGDGHTGHAIRRGGFLSPVIDRLGGVVGGLHGDGRNYGHLAGLTPMAVVKPYTDGAATRAQAAVADTVKLRRLTLAEADVLAAEMAAPGLLRYSVGDGRERYAHYRGLGVAGGKDGLLRIVINVGQSLGIGGVNSSAAAFLTTAVANDILMWSQGIAPAGIFATSISAASLTTMVPAVESVMSANFGETGLVSLAWGLNGPNGRNGGSTYHVATFAKGNTAYSGWKKGTTPYANMIAGITAAITWAGANSLTPVLELVNLEGFENDRASNAATITANIAEFLTDLTADTATLFGSAQGWPLYITQRGLFTSGAADGPTAAVAAASAVNSRVRVVGPQYMSDFEDLFHPQSNWHRLRAAQVAKAHSRYTLRRHDSTFPIQLLAATKSGFGGDATFRLDFPPIRLETGPAAWLTDPDGCLGLSYTDDSATAVIAPGSVRVAAPDRLTYSFTARPNGANPKLRIAWSSGTNTQQGRINGPRACIHDSDIDACPATGRMLPNYPLHQEIAYS